MEKNLKKIFFILKYNVYFMRNNQINDHEYLQVDGGVISYGAYKYKDGIYEGRFVNGRPVGWCIVCEEKNGQVYRTETEVCFYNGGIIGIRTQPVYSEQPVDYYGDSNANDYDYNNNIGNNNNMQNQSPIMNNNVINNNMLNNNNNPMMNNNNPNQQINQPEVLNINNNNNKNNQEQKPSDGEINTNNNNINNQGQQLEINTNNINLYRRNSHLNNNNSHSNSERINEAFEERIGQNNSNDNVLKEDEYNKFINDVFKQPLFLLGRYNDKQIQDPKTFQKKTNVCWLRRLFNCCAYK